MESGRCQRGRLSETAHGSHCSLCWSAHSAPCFSDPPGALACWGRASSCYLSLSSAGFICSQPLLESSRNIKSAGPQIDGEPGPQRTQTKDACPSSHLYSLIIYPRMPWRVHAVEVGRDRCTCLYLDAVPCI